MKHCIILHRAQPRSGLRRLGPLAASLCLLSSCITVFQGNEADITLIGPGTEPVTIQTTRHTLTNMSLPATVSIRRADLKRPISVSSESYRYAPVVPGRKVNGWSVAQLAGPFGMVGLIVDGATHNLYKPKADTYALSFVPRADTLTQLPAFTGAVPARHPIEHRHELAFHAGLGNAATQAFDELYEDELQPHYHLEEADDTWHPRLSVSATYYYHFNSHWAVGGTFGISWQSLSLDNHWFSSLMQHYWDSYADHWYYPSGYGTDFYYRSNATPPISGHIRQQQYYLLPTVKASWGHFACGTFYSRLSVGVAYRHLCFSGQRGLRPLSSDRSGWQVAGGLMPLGIDLGTRHWHGFAEVGAGSEGFIRAGVAYHWGRP